MNKSFLIKILAGVMAVSAVSVGTVVAINHNKKTEEPDFTAGQTVCYAPPADGSLPTDHTGLENVGYMAYTLGQTSAYATEAHSTVDTSVGFISYTQKVDTYKNYRDGVMVVEDITKSSLVNNALQTCFVSGRALWRDPASSSPKDWQGRDTRWAEDKNPSNYSAEDYKRVYGLPCTEFSVYALNENTLTRWSEVVENGDGTYSQTVYPDTEEAGQYYARRMKTMGGLSDYPTFHSIEITYTFDADWRVLSSVTTENYGIRLAVLKSDDCTAVTRQTYSYDAEAVDISDYYSFFSRFIGDQSTGDIDEEVKGEPTAVDYLTEAFAPVLTEGAQFYLDGALDGEPFEGRVYLNASDLKNLDVRAEIAGMPLWISADTAYLRAGGGLYAFPVRELTGALSAVGGLDLESLLAQLAEGKLVADEEGAVLTGELRLGDAVLPLVFSFGRNGEEISLRSVSLTNADVGGRTLSAQLSFDEGQALSALTPAEKKGAADMTGLIDMLRGGRVRIGGQIGFSLGGADGTLKIAEAAVDWREGFSFSLAARLEAAGTVHDVALLYRNGVLRLAYGDLGAEVRAEDFGALSQAFREVYERAAGLIGRAAGQTGAAAEDAAGAAALSRLLASEEMRSLMSGTEKAAKAGLLSAVQTLLSADFGLSWNGEKLTLRGALPDEILSAARFELTAEAGGTVDPLPADIRYIDGEQLLLLCDYALDIFDLTERTEWNISYTMTVNSAEARYVPYGGVRYEAAGGLQVSLANSSEGKPFEAALSLALRARDEGDEDCYLSLTVSGGWAYLSASRYPDAAAGGDAYAPLLLKAELSQFSSLAEILQKFVGADLSFVSGLVNSLSSAAQIGETQAALVVSDLFRGLSVDGNKVALRFNASAFFGQTVDDGSFALERTGETDGFVFSAQKLYYAVSPQAWLNARFVLSGAPVGVVPAEAEYLDVSTVGGLAASLAESFLDFSNGGAGLLDGYYFSGTMTAKLIVNLSFSVSMNVLKEDGSFLVNASVSAVNNALANKGAYQTLLTVDFGKGCIYMRREQYSAGSKPYDAPVVTCRAVTFEEFFADMVDQIVYITNMSSLAASAFQTIFEGAPAPDADGDIGSFLQGYSFIDGTYEADLYLGGIVGMLGDVQLRFSCDETGKIARLGGNAVIRGKLNVDVGFDLEFENVTRPQGDYSLPSRGLPRMWSEGEEIPAAEKEGCVFLGWRYLGEDGRWRVLTENAQFLAREVRPMWAFVQAEAVFSVSEDGRTGRVEVTSVTPGWSDETAEEIGREMSVSYTFSYVLSGKKKGVTGIELNEKHTATSSEREQSYTFGLYAQSASVTVNAVYTLDGREVGAAVFVWESSAEI